ncbi:hypothetical protein AgCh_004995 [Apium graveolens]
MRLSLDVARKFFGLQDMLRELFGEFPQTNTVSAIFIATTSDCEVVSGIDEYSVQETASTKTVSSSTHSKSKIIRRVIKTIFYPFAKESRKKSRDRARELPNDKKERKQQQQLDAQSIDKVNELEHNWNRKRTCR